MESKSIEDVRKYAEGTFASGLYCAESVLLAIARSQGIQSDILPKIATGLCSGMARSCGTCGAVTGAILGIGLVLGRSTPEESVEPAYTAAGKFLKEFELEYGDRSCYVLLGGCDMGTPEGQATFVENNLFERCKQITGKAAEIAARIIADSDQ